MLQDVKNIISFWAWAFYSSSKLLILSLSQQSYLKFKPQNMDQED